MTNQAELCEDTDDEASDDLFALCDGSELRITRERKREREGGRERERQRQREKPLSARAQTVLVTDIISLQTHRLQQSQT